MKKMSMFALLLAAVLVTSYSVSGTYAKYTSQHTATDTAKVAKWGFDLSGNDNETKEFSFNLFNTVLDEDGSEEGNITNNNGTIIAPGTKGSFEIKLVNESEVDAKYGITFGMSNPAGIPVEFSLNQTDWEDTITALNIADVDAQGNDNQINKNNGEATHIVYWRWVFEVADDNATDNVDEKVENDKADTNLGLNGTHEIEVTATITATQIN